MQTKSEGASPSAETEVMDDTVTPCCPPGPSVVMTDTKVVARAMPSTKDWRRSMPLAQIEEALQFDVGHLFGKLVVLALAGGREGINKAVA